MHYFLTILVDLWLYLDQRLNRVCYWLHMSITTTQIIRVADRTFDNMRGNMYKIPHIVLVKRQPH